jgi:hypothetical protein
MYEMKREDESYGCQLLQPYSANTSSAQPIKANLNEMK